MNNKDEKVEDCSSDWGIAFSGSRRTTPLLPDMHATYWYYAINIPSNAPGGDTTGIKFKGQFGHARYQGFNVYNDGTGDLVWGTIDPPHKSSLRDVDIDPDEGSQNPYRPGVKRDISKRDFTVYLVPDGTDVSKYGNNVITFPPADDNAPVLELSVYLRVYLPDRLNRTSEDLPDHLSGWVPLPSISAFNTNDGKSVPCPETRLFPGTGDMPGGPGVNTDGIVHFYRVTAADFYPNQDTAYLTSVFLCVGDTVAVIRIKPPRFTNTSNPNETTPEPTDTRYWSLNVNSVKYTNVTACLADYEAKVAPDGFVYVVLGKHDGQHVQRKARALGYNFLPWGHEDVLLVYRQILPAFASSAKFVDVFHEGERESQSAYCQLKNKGLDVDYAPIGQYMTESTFLHDEYAGFRFPFFTCAAPEE